MTMNLSDEVVNTILTALYNEEAKAKKDGNLKALDYIEDAIAAIRDSM